MKLTRQALRETLATAGPMTASELALFFPTDTLSNVSAQIFHLRRTNPPQIHICGWTRDDGIGRTYLRAIYALGNRRDSIKPKRFSVAERMRRQRAKNRRPCAPNSVFQLAQHV